MILDVITKRKSVFSFSEKRVEKEKIAALFQAAHLAPSSMNVQPWRYIYAEKNENTYDLLFETLMPGNKKWVSAAPLLVLSLAQAEYEFNGKIYKNKHAWHDTGMANALLMLQAVNMNLVVHPMGGFDSEKIKQNVHIDFPFEPVALIAIGYKGDESTLPDDLLKHQQAPRLRKPMNEIILNRPD